MYIYIYIHIYIYNSNNNTYSRQIYSHKISLHIKFHKELRILFLRVYCLEVVCSQTRQVQWLPSQHLIMPLKLFK